MSANYQYSRILLKRSTVSGETPTINTGSTDHSDGTWLDTDIYTGEFFMNTVDDRFWVRTDNGIRELLLSGSASLVSGATNIGSAIGLYSGLTAGQLQFLSLSAGTNVTIDTSMSGSGYYTISATGGGSGNGSFTNNGLNTYTGGTSAFQTVNISGGSFHSISVSGNSSFSGLSASSVTILNSGATTSQMNDWSLNIIRTGVTNSTIGAGSGNTINNDLANVFIAGFNLTGTNSSHSYFNNVVATGTSQGNIYATNLLSGSTNIGTMFERTITPGNYLGKSGSTTLSLTGIPVTLAFALSDETTQITSGTTAKLTYHMPYAMVLTSVRACLTQSGSTLTTVDINENGTSILSTKLTIDANEFSSQTAASAPVISDSNLADDARITFDIDGAGTGAAGLKVTLIGYRTL